MHMGLGQEWLLSMTCHTTLSSTFWWEDCDFLTNSQLCLAYSINTVLLLIPCLWLSPLPLLGQLFNSCIETLTADSTLPTISAPPLRLWTDLYPSFLAGLMPLWTLDLLSAVQDAQGHNKCLLSEGSIRLPTCVRLKGLRMNLGLSCIYQLTIDDIFLQRSKNLRTSTYSWGFLLSYYGVNTSLFPVIKVIYLLGTDSEA